LPELMRTFSVLIFSCLLAGLPSTVWSADAVFPIGISKKYVNEEPGVARMHTCLDQYNANKQVNANGDLHWIQLGGGYY
jgi:hypothetical protein